MKKLRALFALFGLALTLPSCTMAWDPVEEPFLDDDEAEQQLRIAEREGNPACADAARVGMRCLIEGQVRSGPR